MTDTPRNHSVVSFSSSRQQEVAKERWVVALTGASGVVYGTRLIEELALLGGEVHTIVSDAALRVLNEEEGKKISRANLSSTSLLGREFKNVFFYNPKDIGAPIASGSFRCEGMIVVPCSMSSLGAIAHGVSTNLVHRAADVILKENKKLVLVPRETPLSAIHLENMTKLANVGVSILPAMPGFYHRPVSVEQIVDMMVMRILDQIGYHVDLVSRWGMPVEPTLKTGSEK